MTSMKHAEFDYRDPAAIARDFPRHEALRDPEPGGPATRPTRWASMPELTPEEAFRHALAGRGRGPVMMRAELTCWPVESQAGEDLPKKRHTLGQIIAADDGRIEIDPFRTKGQPGCLVIGDRLAVACHPCRRAGHIVKGTLYLPDLAALAAWMTTFRDETMDQPRRVEFRLPAQADEIHRLTHSLERAAGHEDTHQRRQRMTLRAQLVRHLTALSEEMNRR